MPEPGDSAGEPSDDYPGRDDDIGGYREARPDGVGYPPGGFDMHDAGYPAGASDAGYADYPEGDYPDDFPEPGADDDDDDLAPEEERSPTGDDTDEYPDFPRFARQPPAPPPRAGGGHRGGEQWRGGHRSDGGRRGVSIGVIAALVAVVVAVAVVILWRFFGDVLSHRSHTAAGRCMGSKETVAVIADPSIADRVQDFAERYDASATPVGDRCVSVSVKPAGSDAVVDGFIGNWPADLGERPALWIPGSSVSTARLTAAVGQKTISDSRSLVTSPVLLAVRPELQRALGNQNWATLPGLQDKPDALAGLNLPSWGSLRLALPISGNSDAAYLAAEAVAAGSAPPGAPATDGTGAVRTLADGQPKLADNSLAEAMNTLLAPGDPATAPVHAVVTTEQQLFQRGQSLPDAASAVSSWLPPGPVAIADYPTVLLSGSWLSQEQATAASAFARFMHKPSQLADLAKAGFRVQGVKPPSSDVTSFAALPSTLSVGDDTMRATLADTLTAPATGPAATIMLDQSMRTDEGGKTRVANVIAALDDRIKALPPTSVMGLWTFDGKEGRPEVPTGPLADPVNRQPRSAALTSALDKQSPSPGGAVSFTTLRMVYDAVKANFHPGQANSILVITAGPHTDRTLDGPGLQDYIRGAFDPAKPVAVNVIDFGSDPDRATWEAVAHLSSGSYQNLATSASPELATALTRLLS
jgi:hypothetical protein